MSPLKLKRIKFETKFVILGTSFEVRNRDRPGKRAVHHAGMVTRCVTCMGFVCIVLDLYNCTYVTASKMAASSREGVCRAMTALAGAQYVRAYRMLNVSQ